MSVLDHPRVTEGEAGRALAIGELNLAGALVAMDRIAQGETAHVTRKMENAYQQLGPAGRQVLRKFASELSRIVRNG